jgi:antitoxin (DNA-binding transcriptional repressor) of toxin-antitoxin stability system
MTSSISARDLRERGAEIVDRLGRGESFILMRDGLPVGELTPFRRRRFVHADVAAAVFSDAGRVDARRFRADIDRIVDQDNNPHRRPT